MAELFGTPLGQLARGAENRAELGFGLEALKTLGEIEAQPGERAYKESLGRLHAADADLKQSEADAARELQGLASAFQESQAREQLGQAMADDGKIATVADVPKGGVVAAMQKHQSPAAALRRLSEFGKANGMSPISLSKIDEAVSKIEERDSRIMSREARAAHTQFLEATQKRTQLGGVAGFMASSPQNFALGMMDPKIQEMLPKDMPRNYGAAKPFLHMIEQTSMDAQKRAELQLRERNTRTRESRVGASNAASNARAAKANMDLKIATEEYNNIVKTGGDKSQSAANLRKVRQQKIEADLAAKVAKDFPLAPLRPEDRVVGQTYTAANGQRFKWMLPPNKEGVLWNSKQPPVAVLLPNQPKVAGKPAVPASVGADGSDDDDEDDDE